jgi:hypothetical protein
LFMPHSLHTIYAIIPLILQPPQPGGDLARQRRQLQAGLPVEGRVAAFVLQQVLRAHVESGALPMAEARLLAPARILRDAAPSGSTTRVVASAHATATWLTPPPFLLPSALPFVPPFLVDCLLVIADSLPGFELWPWGAQLCRA